MVNRRGLGGGRNGQTKQNKEKALFGREPVEVRPPLLLESLLLSLPLFGSCFYTPKRNGEREGTRNESCASEAKIF